MTIFEFLELLTKERFPLKLDYIEWNKSIQVTVNTFDKTEVYYFDSFGAKQQSTFAKISDTDDPKLIEKHIEQLKDRPERAWQLAAKDLNVRFISPYSFTGIDGNKHEALGLLPDFGCGKGVLLTSRKTDDVVDDMAAITGDYMLTGLNLKYYDLYNREHFIETLSEWGWIGAGKKPNWIIDSN